MITGLFINQKVQMMKKIYNRIISIVFLIILFFSFNKSLSSVIGFSYKELRVVKNFLFLSRGEKMRLRFGKFYDYMQFVKKNTPENAVIAAPPQINPWPKTGNDSYDYYFLFPRIIISSVSKDKLPDNKNLTHVFLVKGDGQEEDPSTIWPKFKVKAEKIIYYPSARKDYLNGWGLIELKK